MTSACRSNLARAHALASGDLDSPTADRVQSHITACRPCGAVLHDARMLLQTLDAGARRTLPPPPDDLVGLIMDQVPRRRTRRHLLLTGGVAAGILAASLLVMMLPGMMATFGGLNLMPGLRAGLAASGQWAARFAALFEAAGVLPGLPMASPAMTAVTTVLPGLGLIASGLAGMAAALTISTRSRSA